MARRPDSGWVHVPGGGTLAGVETAPSLPPLVEFFREVFELSPDGILLIDPDTLRPLEFNDAACAMLGYTRDEFGELSVFDYEASESRDESIAHARRTVRESTTEFDTTFRTKFGDVRQVHVWARTIQFQGRPAFYAIFRDVTASQRQQVSLRLQVAALEAAADGIVITDRRGRIEWVNHAFTALTGYSAAEAVGRNPRELVKSGRHPPEFYRELWDTVLQGSVWEGELINRRKDGSRYHEHQTISPIVDASGDVTHFVAVKRDITERLELEEQFRQAQKMETVGQLASGIAHDFNNLLMVILGLGELVASRLPDVDPIRDDILQMMEAGDRAATLTRQLLAFSRQQVLNPVVLNLNATIEGLEQILRRLLRDDIGLVFEPQPGLGNVRVDAGQIEQVVFNLAVNARDAMPGGGRLTIATRNLSIPPHTAVTGRDALPPGDFVQLSVTDNGVGMDDDTRRRIFEPFFTTKPKGHGTGLGLATVYGIVTQSGGFVHVESAPSRGTTFRVFLPHVREHLPEAVQFPGTCPRSGHEMVMVVEDDPALQRLVSRILAAAGYHVLPAASGEEAIRLLEHEPRDVKLLLTDVVMPNMSGREVADRVTALRPGVKTLYMSGYADDVVSHHGVLDPGIAFLNKPFNRDALLDKVRGLLDA